MSIDRVSANCRGLTLVELMISMVLVLMIMGGSISVFMGSKETFKLEEDLSRVQENFRYIADRLTKDLSVVGHSGCVLPYKNNTSTVNNLVKDTSGVRDVISGTEGDAEAPDSLTLSYALVGSGVAIIGGGMSREDDIKITTSTDLYSALRANFDKAEDERAPVVLLVGNCDGGDIFVPTDMTVATDESGTPTGVAALKHATEVTIGGVSNESNAFSYAYGDTDLSLSSVFFMEDVTYKICLDKSVKGLCVKRGSGSLEMLMPDVTDLQVKYGIDSDSSEHGDADRYLDWSDSIENADITSIKVTLTMLLNKVSGSNVEKVYAFTVKLRNMGLDI